MNDERDRARDRQAGERAIDIAPVERAKSASMLPLVILFQQAWELAHATDLSLDRLEHAAKASALAEAVWHLLAEAGDAEGEARWMIRLSEARHWCAVVHDALANEEERA
jgi:hypothetical protein